MSHPRAVLADASPRAGRSFHRLVVPTDFGDAAERSLEAARSLAEQLDAEIVLVHVFQPPGVTDVTGRKIPADELRLAASHALAATLARLVARHPKSTSDIVEGDPASEIIASAERHKADLIVMGTNGREGLPRLFLGSVTERVVRASPVPVLTISPHVPALAPVVAHEEADGARPASLPLLPLA